ncbi:hypothetical protein MNBD_GAMMA09-3807, partial [hydrothermal vent metagenome]
DTFGKQNGFYLFRLSYIFLLFIFLATYLKQIKSPRLVVFLVLPVFSYFVAHRILLRPELISNILMLLCLILYVRARHSFSHKNLFFVTFLLLIWVNYHSPVLGYIIIFGLFLDRFIHKMFLGEDGYSWKLFYGWAVVVFLVGFVNREGEHFIFSMIDFVVNSKGSTTLEYLPARVFYATNKMVHASWALSVCVIAWSFSKKQYGFSFISILLLYFSWSTSRLVTPVAMINIFILAFLLSEYLIKKEYISLKPVVRRLLMLSIPALALFSYYELAAMAVNEYRHKEGRELRLETRYPVSVTSYMKNYQSGGKILNPMHIGGYLLNYLAPKFQVYLDGRTNILYPISRMDYYLDMLDSPKVIQTEIKKYDVDYVLLENRPWFLSLVMGVKGMKLNYVDDYYMLFSKENEKNAFPVAGLISIVPTCWEESLSSEMKSEYLLAKKVFSDEPHLLTNVLNMLNAYSLSENKKEFLTMQLELGLLPDSIRRLLGVLALKNNMYGISLRYLSKIKINQRDDLFLMVYDLVMMGEYQDAEKTLLAYTNNQVFYFMPDINQVAEAKIITPMLTSFLLSIINKISEDYKLQYFSGEDFNSLKEKHTESGGKHKGALKFGDPSAMFCQAAIDGSEEDEL